MQACLSDRLGRELEVEKFPVFEWTCSGVLEVASDRPSGEFGFCDTCFGRHCFRAAAPGRGSVEVRLGDLKGC